MAVTELLRGLRGLHFSQYGSYEFNGEFENEMYLYNFSFEKRNDTHTSPTHLHTIKFQIHY